MSNFEKLISCKVGDGANSNVLALDVLGVDGRLSYRLRRTGRTDALQVPAGEIAAKGQQATLKVPNGISHLVRRLRGPLREALITLKPDFEILTIAEHESAVGRKGTATQFRITAPGYDVGTLTINGEASRINPPRLAVVALAAGAAALLRAEYTIDTMEWEELAIPLPELPTGAA